MGISRRRIFSSLRVLPATLMRSTNTSGPSLISKVTLILRLGMSWTMVGLTSTEARPMVP